MVSRVPHYLFFVCLAGCLSVCLSACLSIANLPPWRWDVTGAEIRVPSTENPRFSADSRVSQNIALHTSSPTYPSTYLSISLPAYPPTYLPPYLLTYLSIYLPTYPRIHPPIYLRIYLPIYLPTYLYLDLACAPQWGTADTEIEVPSVENEELSGSPFYSFSTFLVHSLAFLPKLLPSCSCISCCEHRPDPVCARRIK